MPHSRNCSVRRQRTSRRSGWPSSCDASGSRKNTTWRTRMKPTRGSRRGGRPSECRKSRRRSWTGRGGTAGARNSSQGEQMTFMFHCLFFKIFCFSILIKQFLLSWDHSPTLVYSLILKVTISTLQARLEYVCTVKKMIDAAVSADIFKVIA